MRWSFAHNLVPKLRIPPDDPVAAAETWEEVLASLEAIGAEVESERPGEAFFFAHGLQDLHGGELAKVIAAAREAAPIPVHGALAPARFASFIAAVIARQRSPLLQRPGERIIEEDQARAFLAPLPTSALAAGPGLPREEAHELIGSLRDLGVETLGELAAISADQLADRFGVLGITARRIACGEDRELAPRRRPEVVGEEVDLPDGAAGVQLDAYLERLIGLLFGSRELAGRGVLAVCLKARLVSGGSWSADQVFAHPTRSAQSMARLLVPRLEELPVPAASLALEVVELEPGDSEQLRIHGTSRREGAEAMDESINQLRKLQGPEAVLRVVDAEPDSRIPERWISMRPFLEEER